MIEEQLKRLEELTNKMNIPSFRKTSIPWLDRNMATRNSDHPNFQEAREIVDELKKAGVR